MTAPAHSYVVSAICVRATKPIEKAKLSPFLPIYTGGHSSQIILKLSTKQQM